MDRLAIAAIVLAAGPFADVAQALDPRREISEYHRQSWQTAHGLPQNAVYDVVQARDGYLWFATVGGLARFDGVRFTSFLPVNTPGLKNGVVWALCASRDGGLWIGTEGGLTRYKDGSFITYTMADGLGGDPIQHLFEDRRGVLWIGTSVPGLVSFEGGRFRRYGTGDGLPDKPVKAVADDAKGNLWVGTGAGLTQMRDGRTKTYTVADGLATDSVSALCVDHEDALWIGGSNGAKARLKDGAFTAYPRGRGRGLGIFSIREDRDGQMWFATAGAGLERLHEGRLSTYQSEEFAALRALALDHEGNLWVGTSNSGVFRLKDTSIVTYSTAEGLADKIVRSVAETKDGRLWISNRYSLCVFEKGVFTDVALPDAAGLYPLLVDRADRLWVGTTNHLMRLDQGRWKIFLRDVDKNLYVHALYEDRSGALWAGTEHGAFRIQGESVRRYTMADGLASDQVFAIEEDSEGGLWFGTRGGGVSRLKDGRFWSYTTADGLSGSSIRAIHADADGTIWIGTTGDGLTRYRDGRFTAFRAKDGLLDEDVFEIAEDDTGHLWLCGIEGLSRFSKEEMNAFAEGRAPRVTARPFGTSDGMRAKTCTHGTSPGATKAHDGRIWFATGDGVVVVDPNDLGRPNARPPAVVVEAVRVDRRAMAPAGPLVLPPGSREIELEYTALSFSAPEKVRFKYKLEGYDADWVDPGTRRTAYYMNLWPGRYTFQVSAANDAGVWNEAGADLVFELEPRFYQTPWFVLLGVGAVALAAWGVMQLRIGALRVREAELATRVNERTRELVAEMAERERVQEALRESDERYALAVRGANDGIWDWNLRTGEVYFSARWKEILGYEEKDIERAPEEWLTRVHSDDVDRVRAGILAHCEGRSTHFEDEHRIRHRDGSYRWVLARGFAVRDTEGRAYRLVGAQTDVTDRRSSDALTGLPNRALFVERLNRALARARHNPSYEIGVLFLDLDRLKVVNDSLGHLAGDRLIIAIAKELESCVRPGDMIARFGGDEFAVLVDSIAGVAEATRVAERIHAELQGIFSVEGSEVFASVSIGIAVSTSGHETAEDLLRDADTAMYRAKSNGRGRYEVFDAAMRAHVMGLLELEGELRRAVERREFLLHYQPVVQLETGTLQGFEALVRWQHPRRGLVGPDQFISVAEETGLIIPLGHWVLGEACRQLAAWRADSPEAQELRVSVNISPRQFLDRELVKKVRATLNDCRLPPDHLILEITEGVLMDVEGAGTGMLTELDALGVHLYIDDFGTGYSSLSYLHRFPVDALKIDRSFVAQLTQSGGDALVRTILTLARNLGIPAVAEGVETAEQLTLLRSLACPFAQGYYFSRPISAADATALIAARRQWSLGAAAPQPR